MSEVRVQDIVAKMAGISLRDTVKVLRSLVIVLEAKGSSSAADDLVHLLARSAYYGDRPAVLHSKPDHGAVEACNEFYAMLVAEYGEAALQSITKLLNDPIFDSKICK